MTAQASLSGRAWAELLLLSAIWGASFLAIRVALDEVPVLTSVAHRVGWAALLLWVVVAVLRLPLPRDPRLWAAFAIMGILNNVIPFGLIFWGQLHIETGLASILNGATAIFAVVVAAAVFPDERLGPRRALGVTLGFLGVAMAIGLHQLADFDIRSLAQLAILGATVSYAFAGAWARKTLSGQPPQVAAAGMLTASAMIMVPLALIFDGPPRFDLSPRTWVAIGYYAVFATAIAYLLYYRVLAMAGSGNLLLCTLLIPPFAMLLGALVLKETLGANAFAGFSVLAIGLLILDGRVLRLGHNTTRKSAS